MPLSSSCGQGPGIVSFQVVSRRLTGRRERASWRPSAAKRLFCAVATPLSATEIADLSTVISALRGGDLRAHRSPPGEPAHDSGICAVPERGTAGGLASAGDELS